MTVLSDTTIADRQLVSPPVDGQARGCTCDLLPGKIFVGGHETNANDFVVDWTSGVNGGLLTDQQRYMVPPSGLVWVRSLQRVEVPDDACGIYFQTNSLSKRGMLLLNTSVVAPGYRGYLTAVLVNFGRAPVALVPSLPVAKLMFVKLDVKCAHPYDRPDANYDQVVAELARSGPESFLQLTSKQQEIRSQLEAYSKNLDSYVEGLKEQLKSEMNAEMRGAREQESNALKSDATGYLFKVFGSLGLALVLLIAVLPWVQGKLTQDLQDRIDNGVQEALLKKIILDGKVLVRDGAKSSEQETTAPADEVNANSDAVDGGPNGD